MPPFNASPAGAIPFELVCFATPPPGLAVSGSVRRQQEQLHLHYRLADPHGVLLLPPADDRSPPQRRDQLWTHTCLELFLAEAGAEAYWELNLSPSGDWNLYRLSGYRQDLNAEPAVDALPFRVERQAAGLSLSLQLNLNLLLAPGRPLELGVCAVLEERSGQLSYWALHHRGPEADFHRRDGLAIRI